MVSVVIPAFNASKWLPETIDSVMRQDFQDFEIVVVDDGSTDDTATWVQSSQDERVRLLSQSNSGSSAARNTGILAAKGQYIAFLDADDLWDSRKLSRQLEIFESFPDTGLVHTGIRYIDIEGSEINRPLLVDGEGDVWSRILLSGSPAGVRCGSTPMVKRAVFDVVGLFDRSLTYSEDWDMWLRIAGAFKFRATSEALTSYRQHQSNKTRDFRNIIPNQRIVLRRAIESNPGRASWLLRRSAFARSYIFAAWRAWFATSRWWAFYYLVSALLLDPRVGMRKSTISLALHLVKPKYRRAR